MGPGGKERENRVSASSDSIDEKKPTQSRSHRWWRSFIQPGLLLLLLLLPCSCHSTRREMRGRKRRSLSPIAKKKVVLNGLRNFPRQPTFFNGFPPPNWEASSLFSRFIRSAIWIAEKSSKEGHAYIAQSISWIFTKRWLKPFAVAMPLWGPKSSSRLWTVKRTRDSIAQQQHHCVNRTRYFAYDTAVSRSTRAL